ncbi:Hypothetical predicted protein [Octopus vulgaris]|uniref:Uncharacterized protein n=1 Tax=Octopus vulgaris TaxID=6645 RepID=A0AA36BMC8_OCTVU|nr:Hypothetical predicted protein [Octopus vulgaris]
MVRMEGGILFRMCRNYYIVQSSSDKALEFVRDLSEINKYSDNDVIISPRETITAHDVITEEQTKTT